MTYDSKRSQVVLFGGSGVGRVPLGDLWSWNGRTWTQRSASGGPEARDAAAFAYDSRRDRLVLVGGRSRDDVGFLGTWEWDGVRWTRMDSVGPGRRMHAMAAFDEARGVTVLFGGLGDGDGFMRDTWTWNGQRWQRVDATSVAVGRIPNGMTYDRVRRSIVMMANVVDTTGSGKQWNELLEWNGRAWRVIPSDAPRAEGIQSLAEGPDAALLWHDGMGTRGDGELWKVVEGIWSLIARGPPSRSGQVMVRDRTRNRLVLFGGGTRTDRFGDTWEFDGRTWVEIKSGR